jgi:hypothetical protein
MELMRTRSSVGAKARVKIDLSGSGAGENYRPPTDWPVIDKEGLD